MTTAMPDLILFADFEAASRAVLAEMHAGWADDR